MARVRLRGIPRGRGMLAGPATDSASDTRSRPSQAAGIPQTSDVCKRTERPACPKIQPCRSRKAAAEYLPADPETWVNACARAGLVVGLSGPRLMVLYDRAGLGRT